MSALNRILLLAVVLSGFAAIGCGSGDAPASSTAQTTTGGVAAPKGGAAGVAKGPAPMPGPGAAGGG